MRSAQRINSVYMEIQLKDIHVSEMHDAYLNDRAIVGIRITQLHGHRKLEMPGQFPKTTRDGVAIFCINCCLGGQKNLWHEPHLEYSQHHQFWEHTTIIKLWLIGRILQRGVDGGEL